VGIGGDETRSHFYLEVESAVGKRVPSNSAQFILGAVPLTKYSYLGFSVQERLTAIMLDGTENGRGGWSLTSDFMVRAQMGEAPVIPEATDDMEELSLLPTQVATR